MPKGKLPEGCMSVEELARAWGKSEDWTTNQLRQDARREFKQYPFAIVSRDKKTGYYSYRIFRKRFESWMSGQLDMYNLRQIVEGWIDKRLSEGA